MRAGIALREDYDAAQLRSLAKATRNAGQIRRLLALAEIYDGGSRTKAAQVGGFRPSMVRSRLRSRKYSAIVPRKLNINRPVGVSVSTFSVSDRTLTPCCCGSWAVLIISRKLRPSRSTFHTTNTNPR